MGDRFPVVTGGSRPANFINQQYSRVCGRVIGYQVGSPDGFGCGRPFSSSGSTEQTFILLIDNIAGCVEELSAIR